MTISDTPVRPVDGPNRSQRRLALPADIDGYAPPALTELIRQLRAVGKALGDATEELKLQRGRTRDAFLADQAAEAERALAAARGETPAKPGQTHEQLRLAAIAGLEARLPGLRAAYSTCEEAAVGWAASPAGRAWAASLDQAGARERVAVLEGELAAAIAELDGLQAVVAWQRDPWRR